MCVSTDSCEHSQNARHARVDLMAMFDEYYPLHNVVMTICLIPS